LGYQQARSELRQQKDANGQPMPYTGGLFVQVAPNYEGELAVMLDTPKIIGTNNNDISFARKSGLDGDVNDYLTSATAWFVRTQDADANGLNWLDQMPFTLAELTRTTAAEFQYIMYESYIAYWDDPHGTWGTTG
jgi:hypothetical protein